MDRNSEWLLVRRGKCHRKNSPSACCTNKSQNLANGFFGIDIKERTARFYDDGTAVIRTSTLNQVGRGVALLLGLPGDTLQKYQNKFFYIDSFHTSQMDMFHSVLKATGTKEKD